jgi:hypothetical protein
VPAPAPPPPPLVVTPAPGSRLEQLLAQREAAMLAAEAAKERAATINDAIKAELTAAYPGRPSFAISGVPGCPALRLFWKEEWRVDVKRMKREDPVTYAMWAKKGGHWELRKADGGGGG